MSEAWIDRYQLQGLVSRGGMSEVWRAYDEVLDRLVAVKVLYDPLGDSVDTERFLREARAAARLAHPNIVATHDIGEWDDRPFLVMEFLAGRTLAEELNEHGPLPIDDIREFGAQAAAALDHAHQAGIVHRDLKPANLMVTQDGTLKLVDFGLAWLTEDAGARLTPDNTAMGTVAYLAPEQATGGGVDERSDLYSLGCVLYELACGRPPFEGSMAAVVLGHVQDEPAPPSGLRPDIPADLEALILHLLAKDPADRPTSAELVRRRLLGVAGLTQLNLASIPTQRAKPQPSKATVRRPQRAALIAVGGLVLVGLLHLLISWALPNLGPGAGVGNGSPLAELLPDGRPPFVHMPNLTRPDTPDPSPFKPAPDIGHWSTMAKNAVDVPATSAPTSSASSPAPVPSETPPEKTPGPRESPAPRVPAPSPGPSESPESRRPSETPTPPEHAEEHRGSAGSQAEEADEADDSAGERAPSGRRSS